MNLEVGQAAQREEQRWNPGGEHGRIGDDHRFGPESFPVRLDEGDEVRRAHLLFALRENDDVDGQAAARGQMRLERLDVQEQLPLVVGGAPCVDAAVADGGLEGGTVPQIERLRGLHVVVPVDEDGRRIGARSPPFAEHDRVAGGGERLGVQARALELAAHPLGGLLRVPVVLGLGRHGGNAQKGPQLVVEAAALPVGVIDGMGHGGGWFAYRSLR